MGRRPCCDKNEVKKGQWSGEEDQILVDYIKEHGHGSWRTLPKNAGLLRCGKSCRLRWTNYLRPSIKRGPFTPEEEATIIRLHGTLGNKWAAIASQIPGRTDNEVKNFWNTHLKKRLSSMAQKLPIRHSFSTLQPADLKDESPSTRHMAQWENARVEAEARLSMESLLLNPPSSVKVEYDHFLRLWNSEVGESFRKRIGKCGRQCESPVCQTSISAIVSSDSVDSKGSAMAKTSTSNDARSNEFTDSSETELKLLLDSSGGNDMEFIQGKIEVVSEFLLSSCYEGYRDKS